MANMFGDPEAANSGFADLLDDPRARAALLQFGINMMQPQYGQSTLGAIGGAIGAGGEAIGRIEEQDRKAAETDSKLSQREAAAVNMQGKLDVAADRNRISQQNAESAANVRDAKSQYLSDKSKLDQEKAAESTRRFGLTDAFRQKDAADRNASQTADRHNKLLRSEAEYFLSAVQAEQKRIDSANMLKSSTQPKEQFNPALELYKDARTPIEIEQVMRNDPVYMERFLQKYGNQTAPQGGGTMQVPNTPRPISGTTEGRTTNYPLAPNDPSMRSDGQPYRNAKGQIRVWNKETQTWDLPGGI